MDRIASGKETTTEAIINDIKLNAKSIPKDSYKYDPIQPDLPNIIRSKNPVTTGGATKGIVIILSNKLFPIKSLRAKIQLIQSAIGRVAIVLMIATFIVNHITDNSSYEKLSNSIN